MSQNNQNLRIKNTIEHIDTKRGSPYMVNRQFSVAPMIDRMGENSIHLIYKNK